MLSVVRVFILIVLKVKQRSERNQRFPFNTSEIKQRNEHSQRFPFNSCEVNVVSVLSEEKQRSERIQRFHFNSSESKNTVVSVVRYFILVAVK